MSVLFRFSHAEKIQIGTINNFYMHLKLGLLQYIFNFSPSNYVIVKIIKNILSTDFFRFPADLADFRRE